MKNLLTAVHFASKAGEVERNLRVARQLCFEAATTGAKVIVLPELCITGKPTSIADASQWAQQRDGSAIEAMREIAAERQCVIVFGYVELAFGNLYNSAAIIGPTGLLANARKRNLTGSDFVWASEGQNSTTAVTPMGRIGVLIGEDVSNRLPETHPLYDPSLRFYPKNTADLICVPTTCTKRDLPAAEWIYLAESLGTCVIVANSTCGISPGATCIISRDRQVWVPEESSSPCIVGGYASL